MLIHNFYLVRLFKRKISTHVSLLERHINDEFVEQENDDEKQHVVLLLFFYRKLLLMNYNSLS